MSDLRERYDFLFDDSGDLTQETLLLYVFGPLENGAREAVEQHVEQCEMCRDAAEGMALLGTKEQALSLLAATDARLLERVEQLKQKVTSSGREALINQSAATDPVVLRAEKPIRNMVWYRYAAAASVLVAIGVAFWFVNFNLNKELSPLSMNQADSTVVMDKEESSSLSENAPLEIAADTVMLKEEVLTLNPQGFGNSSEQAQDDADEKAGSVPPSPFTVASSSGAASGANDVLGAASAKPAAPIEGPSEDEEVVYNDALTDDLVGVVAAPAPAPSTSKSNTTAADEAQKKQEQDEWEKSQGRIASRKDEPTLSKGTGNSNFSTNNISNMVEIDAAIYQAQYPGGSVEMQKYFDKVVYPKDLAKGYKGIVAFEVNFDKTGKITTATIISGLGEPYDKLLLDHLKKMPNWTAPTPEGEPIESVRMVTVEVTVR